jgi:hypothetical protein
MYKKGMHYSLQNTLWFSVIPIAPDNYRDGTVALCITKKILHRVAQRNHRGTQRFSFTIPYPDGIYNLEINNITSILFQNKSDVPGFVQILCYHILTLKLYSMENIQENAKIEIGHESIGYLETTRKWTMFLAILGFIGIGLMLLIGIFAGSFIGKMMGGMSSMSGMEGMEGMEGMGAAKAASGFVGVFMFVFYLILAVIYFFPVLYLLRFSTHTKKAVATLDANELKLGLKYLKSYWKYIGILLIVCISLMLLGLIFMGGMIGMLTGMK